MSKTQESWSKNSSLSGPFKGRQDTHARSSSLYVKLYGNIKEIRGEESYTESFKSGLQIKMTFEKSEIDSVYSDKWFPFDIQHDEFLSRFGNVSSANNKIKSNPVRCVLIYNPPTISTGKVQLVGDLSKVYNNGSKNEAHSLTNLVNGISESNDKEISVWKPKYSSDVNTGMTMADKNVRIASTGSNFMEITENGFSFSGPVNFQANPSQIIYGGFVSPPDFYRGMIPSTPVSPNPTYLPNIPIDTIMSLADLAKIVMSLMV